MYCVVIIRLRAYDACDDATLQRYRYREKGIDIEQKGSEMDKEKRIELESRRGNAKYVSECANF